MNDNKGLTEGLQHPRRSLGNRYRSQAQKFLNISGSEKKNLLWAEQNARQSVLYDFTNEENWKLLVSVKVLLEDQEGARAVLEDLFSVMGRDPVLMGQLDDVEILHSYEDLLLGAIKRDPLDAEKWWRKFKDNDIELEEFSNRLKGLDVSDQRANILFSRRLERIRRGGHEEMFLELSRHLLAHRPNNHEAWEELGRMYERKGEYDEAWLCYDQTQTVFPKSTARDRFRKRMADRLDDSSGEPWKEPPIKDRMDFLDRLRRASSLSSQDKDQHIFKEEDTLSEVYRLRESGRISEAFFLARRMAAEGEEDAIGLVSELLGELND
tara:strand:- start:72 stop:1043 length:972 start_codon:yes stop_codon:yes gene_type:complete